MTDIEPAANTGLSRRLFSSNALKLIAMACMVCDHYSVAFISPKMTLLRWIGRISFPVFAFLIAEGAAKTRNVHRYMLRLLLFAFISEIPFDLMDAGVLFAPDYQNVYFTLTAGLLSIRAFQLLQRKGGFYPVLSVFPLLLLTLGCEFLQTDYSTGGALAIFLFYIAGQCKENRPLRLLLLLAAILAPCIYYSHLYETLRWNWNEIGALFALPLLLLYNGERGKAKINKYLFYAFYPAHLLLFGVIKLLLQ